MRWLILAILLASLIVLIGGINGCVHKVDPVPPGITLPVPELPPAPTLHTEVMRHPVTGEPGIWFANVDAGAELNYRTSLKAAVLKAQETVKEANRLLGGK
jgi:hypothetical protein